MGGDRTLTHYPKGTFHVKAWAEGELLSDQEMDAVNVMEWFKWYFDIIDRVEIERLSDD